MFEEAILVRCFAGGASALEKRLDLFDLRLVRRQHFTASTAFECLFAVMRVVQKVFERSELDPAWDSPRDDPRFQNIVASLPPNDANKIWQRSP